MPECLRPGRYLLLYLLEFAGQIFCARVQQVQVAENSGNFRITNPN